ncbi:MULTISPECIES: PEPxxWA-CTERM sorting domain-containing protein [unclassified Sphingobium]|uniref:PEPxxWA-CTERM sorting domain-containing protein n=1 Tax=unclassified Sphingobium TaxID=2611147 RepID=UPI0022247918|nr:MULTISPECIES: PEPxxWA-CTERM sorting domain-containing protein [unclassified Sphingobium]MCW2393768.1 hypothetical protein [Sphingobium sp. B8D3B]MCW2417281.1 hypothetical protein [Sphingobium sp. B8D3C]
MTKFAMLLGAALMIVPGTAQAAVTVTDYAFTNEFVLGAYPTLSGTFSISHDSDSGVYALTALHYVIEGFTHDLSNSSLWSYVDPDDGDHVVIYGNKNGQSVVYHTTDFDFMFGVTSGAVSTVYSTPTSYVIPAGNTVLTRVEAPPVPEPATWAMMIAGFGIVGAFQRSQKRAIAMNMRLAF